MKRWPTKPLPLLCRPKQWPTLSKKDLSSSGYPVYGANGKIGFADTYTHEHPTILIGCRGSCGTIHITEPKSYANGNAMALDSFDTTQVLLPWAVHFFGHRGFADVVTGTSQPQLTQQGLARIEIPVPPLAEQERIVKLLDEADELRKLRAQADRRTAALLPALFHEMFGGAELNLQRMPLVRLGELCQGSPNYGTMIPARADQGKWLTLRVGNIQDGLLDLTSQKFVDLPDDMLERHTVKDGDLLLARAIGSIDHLGKCIVVNPGSQNWAFDSHLMRVRLNRNLCEPVWLKTLLDTPGGRRLFLNNTRQSAVQFNINTKEFTAITVPLPPLALQKEFAQRVLEIRELEAGQAASRLRLEALFQSLLHRAFNGEL